VFGKVNLDSCCVQIFQSQASTVAEINRGSQFFFECSPGPAPLPILVLNVVFFGKIVPNPSCIPNLKLLVSTVAEKVGVPTFLDATLAKTPANFGPKHLFGKLVPNPICIPNLKLLASTVAKIRRGPNFFMLPWPTPPPILVLNVVF